jgi:Putative Actinobacterial Holin-X, holin superfamily III
VDGADRFVAGVRRAAEKVSGRSGPPTTTIRTEEAMLANVSGTGTRPDGQESLAELVKQLSEQTSRLARQEVELAKTELTEKGKRAGIGAGMFGGSAVLGLYAVGALVAAAILGLATAVAAWLAALIVAVVVGAIAAVVALVGKKEVSQATPPAPEQAAESVKEDVQWAKAKAQAGRQ